MQSDHRIGCDVGVEDGRQRTEVRDQRTEVRGQRTDVRRQRTEFGSRNELNAEGSLRIVGAKGDTDYQDIEIRIESDSFG